MSERYRIVIGDLVFQGKPLPPDASLDLWAEVAEKFVSALDALDPKELEKEAGEIAALIKGSARMLALVPKLRPFLEVYQVDASALDLSPGKFVAVKDFKAELFTGRPEYLTTLLLAACIAEYQGFFENGRSIFAAMVARFGFLSTFANTGRSGDSSSTPGSK